MANGQDQEPEKSGKKPRVTLRDLTASKETHVIGGAAGKPHPQLRDLTASKDARVIRDSGR
jgi:hypothetical protein